MPNSPKCPLCLAKGRIAQTYKVSGRGFYRCGVCQSAIPSDMFDTEDFLWLDDSKTWKENMKSKGIDIEKIEKGVKSEA